MEQILLEDSETKLFADRIQLAFGNVKPKLRRALERNFDKFELYTQRNILRVPAHIDTKGSLSQQWYA
jgi:hypothetical protein